MSVVGDGTEGEGGGGYQSGAGGECRLGVEVEVVGLESGVNRVCGSIQALTFSAAPAWVLANRAYTEIEIAIDVTKRGGQFGRPKALIAVPPKPSRIADHTSIAIANA